MLDEQQLRHLLPIGWIGERFLFYKTIGSTNVEAIKLAEQGAPHGTLVVVDAQTAGKGRSGRTWITLPGTALALSLILRPSDLKADQWLLLFGLGALGVASALDKLGLGAEIKWPNDILLGGKKVAGILINNALVGEVIEYSILGIGLNVTPDSIPHDAQFDFPATSTELELGHPIDRETLLVDILTGIAEQYERINTSGFVDDWQGKLAYLGRMVKISQLEGEITGKLIGLSPKGELIIQDQKDRESIVTYGDLNLRPIYTNGMNEIDGSGSSDVGGAEDG